MKKYFLQTVVLISFMLAGFTSAGSFKNLDENSYAKYESNLIAGLNSENLGLQISSAYFLGEIGSEKAVLSLVKLLRDSENEDLRIISALSLIKIDNELGVYMVKQAQKFNDNEKARSKCRRFYTAYMMRKYENSTTDGNYFVAGVVK
ncbi:MAG: hypothetical protein SCALA702_35640 [Melioribacteraceae bacterium]|nr:MAG: hypothetical protein SCALA702_35640 [Melioribacteraceae bacterium]